MSLKELKKQITKEMLLPKTIFLVAHNNIDLDAFASMVGFTLITKKFKRKTYLIINEKEIEPATKLAMDKIGTKVNIITVKEAEKLITPKSILFILDTNKPKLISCKDLLPMFKTIIVIDHHTKSSETLKSKNLHIEERATSTCEIVASLLNKFRIKVPKQYATLLLGGIALDTNNFMYKMTRKGFFYCYYLATKGADIEEAQMFLKQDLEEYVNRSKMISNTKINGEIAIATGQKGKVYTSQELAKTADLLLEFKGIKTSFAIGYLEKNKVGVSARSIKKIHAGKLMEEFGGGGNKTEAAAIIENASIKKVEEQINQKVK